VLWGALTVYWKQLEGLRALELIGQRIVWAFLLLALVLTATRNWAWLQATARDRRLVGRLALASLLLAANWTTYVWCVTHDNVVETALGYFIAPLGTVLVGVVALHERLRPAQRVALVLATLAVLVLVVGYGSIPWFALVLGSTWAVYGLLKKLVPLTAVQGLTAETLVLLPAAVALVIGFELTSGGIVRNASTGQLLLLLGSGAVTTVPLLLFAAAARRVPLTTLGPLQYVVPSINFLLGTVVYHEPMPTWRLAGFALVWLALAVITIDSLRAARRLRVRAAPVPVAEPV
jgi:chloramphenicol-sensitive protein RarD